MCKVLGAVHNVTYSPHFRIQLSNTFDVYLALLRRVRLLVNQALGLDGAGWNLLNACPPCSYRHGFKQWMEKCPSSILMVLATLMNMSFTVIIIFYPARNDETLCTENWAAANEISEETIKVFEQTGGFVYACWHGLVQTSVEMQKSGELSKYGLATLGKILKVFQEDQCILCQLKWHPIYLPVNFMYNNYKQALSIINEYIPEVEAFKSDHGYTNEHFISWNNEEFTYLANPGKEPPEDTLKVGYIEVLQKLDQQHEQWGSTTTVPWLEYTPSSLALSGTLSAAEESEVKALEAEHRSTVHKLELAMNVVQDIE
ncbi:hypothetical protein JB92DRAFT_2839113 [Gautieria morchelliformis]|nr:hypothetical protein JB92DRAFT_2839113 [Gautieria morchelliformis]